MIAGRSSGSIGVSVSGLGVGERHARLLATLDGVRVLRVFDPDGPKAARVAAEVGAEPVASFAALLDDPQLDVVVVASPDHCHRDQIVEALGTGRHVFTEKPLCNTAAELQAIVDAWTQADGRLHLQSNLVLRSAPLYQWLKQEISAGTFGEIFAFEGDYLYGRLEKLLEGWRGIGANYSGIKGGGVHLIDLMCWLTGQTPGSTITFGNNISTRGATLTSMDYMAGMFRFPSGMVGRITANLGCVHRHHHVVKVYGTRATFIYDDAGPRWHLTRDPDQQAVAVDLAPLPAGKSDLVPAFLDGIRSGVDRREATAEEFRVVSMCFASDRSLASGVEERIEYV